VNHDRRWLYAAVDPETNEFLHARLFSTRTTRLTVVFLRELQQIVPVTQATILVSNAHHLKTALSRLGLRFQMRRHGNRNAVERVLREIKRRTSSFLNTFSQCNRRRLNDGLQAFAVWWNMFKLTQLSATLSSMSKRRSQDTQLARFQNYALGRSLMFGRLVNGPSDDATGVPSNGSNTSPSGKLPTTVQPTVRIFSTVTSTIPWRQSSRH
jgi:putative transposase